MKRKNLKSTINKRGFVVLTFDTEGEFGRMAFRSSDSVIHKSKMFLSYLLGRDYSISALKKIVKLLKQKKMPATFYVVGALYLKNNNKKILLKYLKIKPKTKYLYKGNEFTNKIPLWGDFIENEMKNSLFDFGIHNFLHEDNFVESKDQINKSIKYSIDSAKSIGIKLNSYAAPWWRLEEKRFDFKALLRQNKINILRSGIGDSGSKGLKTSNGLYMINSSYTIKTGKVTQKEYEDIHKGIKNAIRNNSIFCITTHDTTFLRHGITHLKNIVNIIKKYEYMTNICNTGEILNIYNNIKT